MTFKKFAWLSLILLSITTNGLSSNRQTSNEQTKLQRSSLKRGNKIRLVTAQPISVSSMSGIWDFKLSVNRMVGRDGFVRKQLRSFEWVIRFKQEVEKLSGDLVGGRGSRGEGVCADADVSGSVKGGRINFIVAYQGSCCSQEQMKFVGELSDDGTTLTGNLEPVDVPRTYCELAYADVTAVKR